VSQIKLMVVGDTHGNITPLKWKLMEAGKRKLSHVLIVGDFGLSTHFLDGQVFLDEVQELAGINKLTVYAIPGNHENHDHWNWAVENLPKSKGFAMIRSRVALAPKAHHWTWNNKQFVSAGGAVSIDKEWRLQEEARNNAPKTLSWPNETLTEEDLFTLESWEKKADYLITHDCSNYTPFKNRLQPDLDSQIHRQSIDRVLRATKPELHFHGHMHERYDWINLNTFRHEHGAQTYGLECDGDWYSWGILDTTTDEFTWRGEDELG